MASVVSLVLFVVMLGLHTLAAAVMTRYFRITLKTRTGWVVFSLFFIPLALLFSTLVFTGVLGIGPNLGSAAAALAVTIGLPLGLGMVIDVLYVPSPEAYDLPDTAD